MKFLLEIYLLVGMRLGPEPRLDIKNEMAVKLLWMETGKQLLEIGIEPNEHYQNVDIGLEFILEAPKSQNIHIRELRPVWVTESSPCGCAYWRVTGVHIWPLTDVHI